MPAIHLLTHGDTSHAAAADALCPESALPPGWTRIVGGSTGDVSEDTEIVVDPRAAAVSRALVRPGRIVVSGHAVNSPLRRVAPWVPGLVAVAARSSQGTEPRTSYGPGLGLCVDTGAVLPADAQSWAVLWIPVYLAWASETLGSRDAAVASLFAAARLASGQPSWTEDTGYGILPAFVLPAPGALLSTASPAWVLYGNPAGASITPMTLDGREGVRIVAGVGSSRLRARALFADYEPGRLYRVRTYMRNLSDTSTAHLVARVSESPFGLAPGEAIEADVWEMQAAPIQSGYDPSWQLRSGLVEDDADAVLDVFVTPPVVETYTGGALSLPPIADPEPVAPYAVTATYTGTPGTYAIAWHTVPDPGAECVVSVDGADVATGASPLTVYLGAGAHTVRVRLLTGDVAEEHSTVAVTSDADYVPSAPVVEVGRDGDVLVIAWASVPGSAAYRVTVAPGVGEDAEVTMEDTLSPTLLTWPGAAEVRVYAVGPSGEESPPGVDYAAGSGVARAVPLW